MDADAGAEAIGTILDSAKDFHGHLGPFLAMGVRVGLVGLRELRTSKKTTDLHVKALLEYSIPHSCILDGLQVTTGCTIGNKRLTLENSSAFSVTFTNSEGTTVTVSILRTALEELQGDLKRSTSCREVERLAFDVASKAESDLFVLDKSQRIDRCVVSNQSHGSGS
jgi:formylmethanofuran dehydrogenase subunit E